MRGMPEWLRSAAVLRQVTNFSGRKNRKIVQPVRCGLDDDCNDAVPVVLLGSVAAIVIVVFLVVSTGKPSGPFSIIFALLFVFLTCC